MKIVSEYSHIDNYNLFKKTDSPSPHKKKEKKRDSNRITYSFHRENIMISVVYRSWKPLHFNCFVYVLYRNSVNKIYYYNC